MYAPVAKKTSIHFVTYWQVTSKLFGFNFVLHFTPVIRCMSLRPFASTFYFTNIRILIDLIPLITFCLRVYTTLTLTLTLTCLTLITLSAIMNICAKFHSRHHIRITQNRCMRTLYTAMALFPRAPPRSTGSGVVCAGSVAVGLSRRSGVGIGFKIMATVAVI